MTTWEQIVKANAAISTTAIKGKDYAEVNQRVKAFRMVYPTGLIKTEMLSNDNGVCVFKATVGYDGENGRFVELATGTAFESQSASYINKTSYIENCETSAVGRALGFCGFGIDTSICSAEELTNALAQQEHNEPKEIPTEIFGTPIEVVDEPPIPKDTHEDAEYRILALRAYTVKKLDEACMSKFKTDFRHTPVAMLRTVLTEEMLNAKIEKEAQK